MVSIVSEWEKLSDNRIKPYSLFGQRTRTKRDEQYFKWEGYDEVISMSNLNFIWYHSNFWLIIFLCLQRFVFVFIALFKILLIGLDTVCVINVSYKRVIVNEYKKLHKITIRFDKSKVFCNEKILYLMFFFCSKYFYENLF